MSYAQAMFAEGEKGEPMEIVCDAEDCKFRDDDGYCDKKLIEVSHVWGSRNPECLEFVRKRDEGVKNEF